MEHYRYKNAIIYVRGNVDRHRLEEATIKFIKKADKCRRNKVKEKIQNGDKNTSGTVREK